MSKIFCVTDKVSLYEATDYLKKFSLKATDIESSTLSPYSKVTKPQVGIVGFAASRDMAFIYPVHSRVGASIKVSSEAVLEAVQSLWEDPECKYICHYGKHDYSYMAVTEGIWLQGFLKHRTGYSYDTGQASYCLDERPGSHGLKEWAWKLGMGGYELDLEQYKREHPEARTNYNLVPLKILGPYCGNDCITTFKLHSYTKKRLIKSNRWKNPYLFPQMTNNWTCAMLQIVGIKTDLKRNKELQIEFPEHIKQVEKELLKFKSVRRVLESKERKLWEEIRARVYSYKRKVAKPKKLIRMMFREKMKKFVFKWTPEDRRILIYDILKYPVLFRTKGKKDGTGQLASIDKKALAKLIRTRKNNKVMQKLMERGDWYYGYTKYVKPFPLWEGSDGRTHTEWDPRELTGRVASKDPNHSNIPKRNKIIAPLIRSQLVPSSEDHLILAADYKQMELRLLADRSKDEVMIEEFRQKKDPHKMGAAAAFEIPESEVTKEQRDMAKSAVSFGLVYGRSAAALAPDFGQPIEWAEAFKDRYFGKYRRIPEYWKHQEEFAKKHKYVISNFGRWRHLPGIDSEVEGVYKQAVRFAINSPIQGDGNDCLWTAGYRMCRWLHKYRMRSKATSRLNRFLFYHKSRNIIHIHDDLTLDVYRPELQDVLERMQFYMMDRKYIKERTGWFSSVPFDIDCFISDKHLGQSVELQRKGDEFIVPSKFLN